MHALDPRVLESMFDDLAKQGWAQSSELMMPPLCEALYQAAKQHQAWGDFQRAGIGKSGNPRDDVRGDSIHWLSFDAPAERAYLTAMHALLRTTKAAFLVALNAYEAHFACYDPGQFYRKHIDRFQGEASREFSTILFLNPDWGESDGGALVLYPEGREPVRILPQLGSFVLFRSETIAHEVEPPRRTRFSIAGWMKKLDPTQALLSGTLVPDEEPSH